MELVTGRSGKPHITSQQVRQLQQGILGRMPVSLIREVC